MTPALQSALSTSVHVGAWETDLDTQTVEFTGTIADLLGIDRKRAAAGVPVSTFLDGVHPEDRADVAHRVHEAHSSAGRFEAEFRTDGQSDAMHFILARGQVEPKPEGRGLRCVGIMIDVTESRCSDRPGTAERLNLIQEVVDGLLAVRPAALQLGSPVLKTLIDIALFDLGRQVAKHMAPIDGSLH